MVFTIRGHYLGNASPWEPGTACTTHHMSPVTRADNDASLMFPRQDKQIGSDNSDVTKEAEMAGYKSTHCPHLVKHFLHFSGQDMTEHPGLTTNTKCQPEV